MKKLRIAPVKSRLSSQLAGSLSFCLEDATPIASTRLSKTILVEQLQNWRWIIRARASAPTASPRTRCSTIGFRFVAPARSKCNTPRSMAGRCRSPVPRCMRSKKGASTLSWRPTARLRFKWNSTRPTERTNTQSQTAMRNPDLMHDALEQRRIQQVVEVVVRRGEMNRQFPGIGADVCVGQGRLFGVVSAHLLVDDRC